MIDSGTYHRPDLEHFHIICTDPDEDDRQLIVSISSIVDGEIYDAACVLDYYEHKFIKHPSFVKYDFAKIAYRKHLLRKLAIGAARPYPPDVDNEVFQKVLEGIDVSDHVEPAVHRYYHKRKNTVAGATNPKAAPARSECLDFRYRAESAAPRKAIPASST